VAIAVRAFASENRLRHSNNAQNPLSPDGYFRTGPALIFGHPRAMIKKI
jgi:hypothetical protein